MLKVSIFIFHSIIVFIHIPPMNNKKTYRLTPAERLKLAEIKGNFELVDEIFGSEPGIYFDFDIPPSAVHGRVPLFMELQSEFYTVLKIHRTKV